MPNSSRKALGDDPGQAEQQDNGEKNSSTKARIAARARSDRAPTTAKKISVDSTSKLPPSTSGLPKSARLSMKPSRKALARPGRISGSEHGAEGLPAIGAQRLRGFLHRGLTPSTTPISTRKAIGVKARTCAISRTGQAVDPARRLDAEQHRSAHACDCRTGRTAG